MGRTRKVVISLMLAALAGCGTVDNTAEPSIQNNDPSSGAPAAKATPAKKAVSIKLQAKRATAARSVLSDGGALSCVRVTVTNHMKRSLPVNPLYFSITDTGDTKHDVSSALGEYEGQIDTMTLAPGENTKGMVCAKGKFTPKIVAMTNELFSDAARARVS